MKITIPITDFVASLIRTLVPLIVGWALSLPITPAVLNAVGWSHDKADATLTTALAFVLSYLYYLLIRALEKAHPAWGVFLGVPAQPTYVDTSGQHVAPPASPPIVGNTGAATPVVTSLPAPVPPAA